MTITTYALGTNTKQFSTAADANGAGLIAAVNTFLIAQGWTQVDTTTAYGLVTNVYTAPNLDATTVKYLILRWDTIRCKMYSNTCESWNAGTHVATNEAFNHNNLFFTPFLPNSTDFVVFATAQYAIFQSYIRAEPSAWAGVVEIEREAVEDTAVAGYPCWGWINSHYFGASDGAFKTWGTTNYGYVSLPRSKNGNTGVAASLNQYVSTAINTFPSPSPTGTVQGTKIAEGMTINATTTYGWDANKKAVATMRLIEGGIDNTAPIAHGRICGIKAVPLIGEAMSKTNIPVDANMFYSSTGTGADHWVLNCTAKTANAVFESIGTNYQSQTSVTLPSALRATATDGLYYYVATTAGVYKIDSLALAISPIISAIGAVDCYDIQYDGGQFMWVSTPTGISKIDTLNSDAVTSLALAGGGTGIAMDGTIVVTGSRTTSTSPGTFRVNQGALTLAGTVTYGTVLTAAQSMMSFCTDWSGNFYASHEATVLADNNVYKIVSSSGALTRYQNVGTAQTLAPGLYYDGTYLNHFWYDTSNYTNRKMINPTTMTLVTTATTTSSATTNGGMRSCVVPLCGRLYVSLNSLGAANYWSAWGASSVNDATHTYLGASGIGVTIKGACTDGVRFISAASTAATVLYITSGFNNRYKSGNLMAQFLLPL